ncbi:hypothetical protein D1872_51630 [compost metagenome]
MRIKIAYKIDHRLKLVQISTGDMKFLVHWRVFESMVHLEDPWEETEGRTRVSLSNYQTLYRERLQ